MTESVLIYTKEPDATGPCPFCDQAKAWLKEQSIPFTEKVLGPAARQIIYDELRLTGTRRTVPQIILIDGGGEKYRIGGYAELEQSRLETLFGDPKPR